MKISKFTTLLLLLLAISFSNSYSQDATWFTDVTSEKGLGEATGSRLNVVDVNNDNYPDLLFGSSGAGNGHFNWFKLYLNVPDPNDPTKRTFIDFTEESNINANRDAERTGRNYDLAVMADINNDGFMDMVSSIYYHRWEYISAYADSIDKSEVLLNDGTGRFILVDDNGLYNFQNHETYGPGLIDACGLSFLDYDLDGNLDLYIATKFKDYAKNLKMTDILMKGNGDGTFTYITNAGIEWVTEPMYGVNVTDWNNDGWQDVITSPYCRSGGSLFMNRGDGTFLDMASQTGYTAQKIGGDNGQPLCQWEAPTADFDNDGDMDFLQIEVHGGLHPGEGHSHITVNSGAPDYKLEWELDRIVRDENIGSHLGDYGGMFSDFDNDGWLDICICQGHYTPATDRVYFCRQNDEGIFEDITAELVLSNIEDAHSIESLDFDLDGDNDILYSHNGENGTEMRLLRNDVGNKKNWVSVELDAPEGCNQNAVGARIQVWSNGIGQIREIQTGLGHFGGQQPFIRNVGLGEFNRIDSILVRWPMAGFPVTKVEHPPLNMILKIDENGNAGFVENWNDEKIPIIAFRAPYTDFGFFEQGESLDTTMIIKNIGTEALEIKDLEIIDDDHSAFTLTAINFPIILAPDEELEVTIGFAASIRAKHYAMLNIKSNAFNGSDRNYDLYAEDYLPSAIINSETNPINFVDVNPSETKDVIIENVGEIDMTVSSISITVDEDQVFSIEDLMFPLTIPEGEDFTFQLAFNPKHRTDYYGEILIESDAYNEPEYLMVINATSDLPTAKAEFGKGTLSMGSTPINRPKEKTFPIENNGDFKAIINELICEDCGDVFTFVDVEYPLEIEPQEEIDVIVEFAPTEITNYSATVSLRSNSLTDDTKMNIIGRGTEVVSVEEEGGSIFTMSINPNPATGQTRLTYIYNGVQSQKITVSIFDLQGRLIRDLIDSHLAKGEYSENIELSEIQSGTYLIVANVGDRTYKEKLQISK